MSAKGGIEAPDLRQRGSSHPHSTASFRRTEKAALDEVRESQCAACIAGLRNGLGGDAV